MARPERRAGWRVDFPQTRTDRPAVTLPARRGGPFFAMQRRAMFRVILLTLIGLFIVLALSSAPEFTTERTMPSSPTRPAAPPADLADAARGPAFLHGTSESLLPVRAAQ